MINCYNCGRQKQHESRTRCMRCRNQICRDCEHDNALPEPPLPVVCAPCITRAQGRGQQSVKVPCNVCAKLTDIHLLKVCDEFGCKVCHTCIRLCEIVDTTDGTKMYQYWCHECTNWAHLKRGRVVRKELWLLEVEEERQRLNATTVSLQAFFDGSAGAGPRTLGSSWRALRADGIRDTPAIPHAACGNCNRDTASQDMLSCKQWTRDEEGEPQPVQCLRLFCRECEHYVVTFDDDEHLFPEIVPTCGRCRRKAVSV